MVRRNQKLFVNIEDTSVEENVEILIISNNEHSYELVCERGIREHLDAALNIEKGTKYMTYPQATEEQVKKNINKMKSGKAAGPDGLKPELYKVLKDSPSFITVMTNSINKITENKKGLSKWKTSNTAMAPKKNKPRVLDLRPLAMTDISYKLYMNVAIRDKVEEHIVDNNLVKEAQSGCTEKGRIEILQFTATHFLWQDRAEKLMRLAKGPTMVGLLVIIG